MLSVLQKIFCFLREIPFYFHDLFLNMFDSLLSGVGSIISAIGGTTLAIPSFDNSVMWVAGLSGIPAAIGVIASALVIRFLLQTIPFVRWGS